MPTLSAMLITKNEAGVIARCIDSLRPVATQIIVADTGSTDGTMQIARDHGAIVVEHTWQNDFSAARNAALAHATGEWCMGIDADEELLSESIPHVRAAIENSAALGYFVTLQNLDDPGRPDIYTEMTSLRIMRRIAGAKFVGRIHEHIDPPIETLLRSTGQKLLPSAIKLRHTGFAKGLKAAKLQRAVGLLELELKERPNQLYYMIEYGRTLIQLGNMNGVSVLADAARETWKHKDGARAPIPSVALLLEFVLLGAESHIKDGPIGEAEALFLAEKWFPNSAPLLWFRAKRYFARNEFAPAARCLEKLVEMGRTNQYDRSINFDPRILRGDAVLNLGVCYLRLAEVARAEACFKSLLGDAGLGESARRNLEVLERVKRS